ncbi:Serine hydrolase-like protein [Colletotrichum shisoi]|uniref:Serine hydrolase-like protein n=1 Tax=Colletotrichum shisoi TaxID=2078593 RepID=A0A5Q4BQA0_9PEZI|nr:Serine hydrolase-like protein [Colletotrichum shisoi]
MYSLFSSAVEPRTATIIATTVVATLSVLSLARLALYPKWGTAISNPLKTKIPTLEADEVKKLPYHPDSFPGARDVETPYGSIRVYEWGSTTGPKVILIHGITTSCMTLGPIAHALAARGCRVMLFDLFGRGFSDGVGDLPHDARLYTTQVLLALASSPLAWSGTSSIRVIGYSLGGAIAASFAAAFPHMVESLVLLAPAGLIRAENFGVLAQLTFQSGLVPERILAALTRKRLQKPLAGKRSNAVAEEDDPAGTFVDIAAAEVSGPKGTADGEDVQVERKVREYVPWMVAHHEGFVPAFMSCVRWAPLTGQHEAWRALGKRVKGTTAVFIGRTDEVIDVAHYVKDGLPLLGGKENVLWKVLPGGHDFVMTKTEFIMRELDSLWGFEGAVMR